LPLLQRKGKGFFFEVLHGENERSELRRKTHLREKKLKVAASNGDGESEKKLKRHGAIWEGEGVCQRN